MAYKIGIFVYKKGGGERLVKWLPEKYETFESADHATDQKNKDLKADLEHMTPGQKYAMFDSV